MSDQNKALVRRFYEEVFNAKNVDAIDELCHPDFVDHMAMPDQAPGSQGLKKAFADYLNAFPDMQVQVQDVIAEGDLVATRFTGGATHRGEIFGAAPTGKRITFNGIDIVRIRDGKAVEAWHQGDDIIGLMQIGAKLPMPSV
jgi:predicted ester cyclase